MSSARTSPRTTTPRTPLSHKAETCHMGSTKNLNKLDKLFGENEDIVGRLCQTNTIRKLMKQFLNKCKFVNPRTDIVSKQKWHWNSHYNDHGIRPTSAYFIVVKGFQI